MTTFVLSPCTEEDIPAMVSIYFAAFANDAISLHCFPRTPSSRQFWEDDNRNEMRNNPEARFLKMVEQPSGKMVAYAKWRVPVKLGEGEYRAMEIEELAGWPDGSPAELCNEIFGGLLQKKIEHMGNKPYYFLEMLATLPEYQGRGCGSELIAWGVREADKAGLEAYLEASAVGLRLYEKFGFKFVDQVTAKMGDDMDMMVCMVRKSNRK